MSNKNLNIAANQTKVNLIGPQKLHHPLDKETFSVFVDGGINHQSSLEIKNFESIGDNDSHELAEQLNHSFPADKNKSDFALALEHLSQSVKEVNLYGFWGGRQDHFLFNIGESLEALNSTKRTITLYGPKDYFIFFPAGKNSFTHNSKFSLLTSVKQNIQVVGAKYSGDISLLPFSSHGLSNSSDGKVEISNQSPLGVFINS